MKTKLHPRLLEVEVTHQHSMGPWAIVQVLDDEYVRVGGVAKKGGVGGRAFLAWVPKLSAYLQKPDRESPLQEVPFNNEQMAALEKIRGELHDGTKKVVSTYIVPA